jgi:hypothetical protein
MQVNKSFLIKIHIAPKVVATVRIAKSLVQYFWIFSFRSAAGRKTDKMLKLYIYNETCLKRSLDRTQSCI